MRGEDAHLTALAAVADAYAYIAREKADAAQRALSEINIFVALLDEAPRSSCWRPCLTPPTAPSAWACALRLSVPKSNRGVGARRVKLLTYPSRWDRACGYG